MNQNELFASIDAHVNEGVPQTLVLLETLVNTGSFSRDSLGTAKVQQLISSELNQMGFSIEKRAKEGEGVHVLARLPGKEKGTILLLGHVDTAHPPGTVARRPFSIDGRFARGPGVSDMKAGLAAGVLACRALIEAGWEPRPTLEFLLTPDEEIGSPGSRQIIEERANGAMAVLNLEPARPDGSVVVARRGSAHLLVRVTGRAAHSGGNFDDGISAIVELANKIVALHELNSKYPAATVNTGVIEGGSNTNVVAATAKAQLHIGFWELGDAEAIMADVRDIVERRYVEGAHSDLVGDISFLPMEETERGKQLYNIVRRSAKEIGVDLGSVRAHGAADSGFPAALGIPTLCGLGPVGGNWHAEDEFMELESFPARVRILARSLVNIAAEFT